MKLHMLSIYDTQCLMYKNNRNKHKMFLNTNIRYSNVQHSALLQPYTLLWALSYTDVLSMAQLIVKACVKCSLAVIVTV